MCICEERIYFQKQKYLCLYAYSSALVITKNNNENSKTMSNYIVSTTEKGEERKGINLTTFGYGFSGSGKTFLLLANAFYRRGNAGTRSRGPGAFEA